MKIALAIEYDGSAFRGWQAQACGQTVQNTLQQALAQVAQENITTTAAGRTDAGVHAALMPVHFNSNAKRQPSMWVRGCNAHLPATVKVLWATPVQENFHARYSAQRRYYQYILLNRPTPPGLFANAIGYCHADLDVPAMRRAARSLRGEYDFSAFRAAACQAKTSVRQLHYLRIRQRGQWIVFDFCGNGFLHHMIRNIVGALLYVGRKRRSVPWLRELRLSGDRTLAPPTAAASGLYFNGASYEQQHQLPSCYRPAPLPLAGGRSVQQVS